MIVGLWGLESELERAAQRLESVRVTRLDIRVRSCVDETERLAAAGEAPAALDATPGRTGTHSS